MKTVSSNLQEVLWAADGMACGYLPRSVENQKNIQNQGGGGWELDPGFLSPRQMYQARSESISRGVCLHGAPDYGKVINLDALHAPTPTTRQPALRWLPEPCLSLLYCILLSALMLQVRHSGGKNTNKVVSYSFFKAVGTQYSKRGLPRALCVCACLSAGRAANPSPASRRDGLHSAAEDYIIRIVTVLHPLFLTVFCLGRRRGVKGLEAWSWYLKEVEKKKKVQRDKLAL